MRLLILFETADMRTSALLLKDHRNLCSSGSNKHVVSFSMARYTYQAVPTVVLPVYEFFISFDQEVAAVWARGKKLSFGSFLLISTRWCMVVLAVIVALPSTPTVRNKSSRSLSIHPDIMALQRCVCDCKGLHCLA